MPGCKRIQREFDVTVELDGPTASDCGSSYHGSEKSPSGLAVQSKQPGTWLMAFFLLVTITLFTTFAVMNPRTASLHNIYIEAYDTVSRQKLRPVTMDEAHINGVAHWATWVLVLDLDKDVILLQKRSQTTRTCPGAWSLSGEHLEPNETTADTAVRGLKEELGLSVRKQDLVILDNFLWRHAYKGGRFDVQNSTIYLYHLSGQPEFTLNDAESEKAVLLPLETFRDWCENHPARMCGPQFASAYLQYLRMVCKKHPMRSAFCAKNYHGRRAHDPRHGGRLGRY
ncbi:Isopentenyl-diphosphate Delta-isomerase 2 [Diplonema papillatum]|nr:Isopentenyl-diphosphate Delta-isomerase 2 [Diplonema papillatum]